MPDTRTFTLDGGRAWHPDVEDYLAWHNDERGSRARAWFARMRDCGDDVRELVHDGQAVACVRDIAFAYVAVFKAHVNVGFFAGATLPDPAGLLEGSGKRMRHVKLRPGAEVDEDALGALVAAAYRDAKSARGGA